jgi:hypothetical protein
MATEKPDREKSIDEVCDKLAAGMRGSDTEYLGGVEVLRRQLKLTDRSVAAAENSARYALWAAMAAFAAVAVAFAALFK